MAKNCPTNIKVVALMDKCKCVRADTRGLSLGNQGTLIECGSSEMPSSYSHLNPNQKESEKSFSAKVAKVALNLTKSSGNANVLLEFPTMPGKFFRMMYEESIEEFIDYTIN